MPLKQRHPRECQMSQDRRHHHIYKEQDQIFGAHSSRITYIDIITKEKTFLQLQYDCNGADDDDSDVDDDDIEDDVHDFNDDDSDNDDDEA